MTPRFPYPPPPLLLILFNSASGLKGPRVFPSHFLFSFLFYGSHFPPPHAGIGCLFPLGGGSVLHEWANFIFSELTPFFLSLNNPSVISPCFTDLRLVFILQLQVRGLKIRVLGPPVSLPSRQCPWPFSVGSKVTFGDDRPFAHSKPPNTQRPGRCFWA